MHMFQILHFEGGMFQISYFLKRVCPARARKNFGPRPGEGREGRRGRRGGGAYLAWGGMVGHPIPSRIRA